MAEGLDWPWPSGPAYCLEPERRGSVGLWVGGVGSLTFVCGWNGGGLPLALLSCNNKGNNLKRTDLSSAHKEQQTDSLFQMNMITINIFLRELGCLPADKYRCMDMHVRQAYKHAVKLSDTNKCTNTPRELPEADWCILFLKQQWEISEASLV